MLITSEVGDVLVAHLGVDRSRLLGPARLDEDLGLDSLALTEALLALEDELAISIPDPVQAGLHTFDDLVAVVASQLSGTATAHRRCAAVAERSSGGDAGRR